MLYLMYAVVFRFGAFQIVSDDPIIHEEFNDVFRTFIALVFGAFSIGQASAFAPNYVKAKLSSNRIFALLDREPVIDNYDESGQKLVSAWHVLHLFYRQILAHTVHLRLVYLHWSLRILLENAPDIINQP